MAKVELTREEKAKRKLLIIVEIVLVAVVLFMSLIEFITDF